MKLRISFVLLIVMVCSATTLFSQPYVGEKGDVNEDEAINVLDMLTIANHILGLAMLDEPGLWRADLNGSVGNCDGDGSVNVLDMVKIANIILGSDVCPRTTVTDIDGNEYQTVTIGTQVWMTEDLRVTHYRNGDPIPDVTDNTAWMTLESGAYCNFNNDANPVPTYGRLYNWSAVSDNRNIAPEGWHVPTDEEWKQLEMYLGMSQSQADTTGWRGTNEGEKMKESGASHWPSSNTATNESGFTVLPCGYRSDGSGNFFDQGALVYFWSFSEYDNNNALGRHMVDRRSDVNRDSYGKRNGFSVRCLQD